MLSNSDCFLTAIEGDWPSYGEKFVSSDNPGQIIWHKVKRFSKIGQDFKNLLSNFACFLTAIIKV